MGVRYLDLEGKKWAILPEAEYRRLLAKSGERAGLPKLPLPDGRGTFPAVEYARASLARKIIQRRRAAGLAQAQLARLAGIRPETLCRIERGKHTPDVATIAKIERALETARGQ